MTLLSILFLIFVFIGILIGVERPEKGRAVAPGMTKLSRSTKNAHRYSRLSR